MDRRTGDIYEGKKLEEFMAQIAPEDRHYVMEVPYHNLHPIHQLKLSQHHHTKIGRNEPCPCGSGKKFKRCCYMKG